MTRTFHIGLKPLAAAVMLAGAQHTLAASDLFLSEYIEGSSNNKALEIANTTDAAINLAAYEIQFYFNGSATAGRTFNLQGTVAAGDVFVLASASADPAILAQADQSESASFYNGDDVITLLNGGVVIDSFGQIGTDPGSAWGSGETSAQNATLRRKSVPDSGDSDTGDAFDPALEWNGFPVDNFDDLGSFSGGGDNGPGDGTAGPEAGVCFEPATSIHDVQGSGASSPLVDQQVIIEGVVSGLRDDGFFMQEEAADQDGLTETSEGIYVVSEAEPAPGSVVRIAGQVAENFGLTQIGNTGAAVDCGQTAEVTTTALTAPLANGQSYESTEGMQVSVSDLRVTDVNNLWRFGEIGLSAELVRQPTDLFAPGTAGYDALVAANSDSQIFVEDDSSARFPSALSFYQQFSYDNSIRIGDRVSVTGPLNFAFGKFRINPNLQLTVNGTRTERPDLRPGNLTVASFNVLNYFNGEVGADGSVTFDYPANRGADNAEAFALQEARIVSAMSRLDADVIGLMEIENDGYGQSSAIQSLVNAVNAAQPESEAFTFVSSSAGGLLGSDAIAVGLL